MSRINGNGWESAISDTNTYYELADRQAIVTSTSEWGVMVSGG